MKLNTIKRKTYALITMFLLMTVISASMLGVKYIELLGSYESLKEGSLKLKEGSVDMKQNITEIQQWLTDISATRALDGLNDGFDEANKSAELFKANVEKIKTAAATLESEKTLKKIKEVERLFPAYKQTGEEMANLYIKKGTAAGNAFMEQFDVAAANLKNAAMQVEEMANEEFKKVENEYRKTVYLFGYFLLGSFIVFTILIIISARGVLNNIIKPINDVKSHLENFFRYIKNDIQEIDVVEVTANDEIAMMLKFINENVLEIKMAKSIDDTLLKEIDEAINNIRNGDLTIRISSEGSSEGLEALKNRFNNMIDGMAKEIGSNTKDIKNRIQEYSQLNFTKEIQNAEGEIEKSLNILKNELSVMLGSQKDGSEVLKKCVMSVEDTSLKIANGGVEQSKLIEESNELVEELTKNISETAEQSREMVDISKETIDISVKGNKLVDNSLGVMSDIAVSTKKIEEAVVQIEQIAFQTNILSLNAAVEAATAGEHGKGFAVVAGEVRNLASKSADAAKSIKLLVSEAIDSSKTGLESSREISESFGALQGKVDKTNLMIENISQASENQREALEQILQNTNALETISQDNSMVIDQANKATIDIREVSLKMIDISEKIKV